MSAPLEKNITKSVLAYLRSLDGCRVQKRHGGLAQGGEPDITGCFRGHHLEIEVKRPGAKLTARQLVALDRWSAAGAATAVVYSRDDAREFMEGFFSKRRIHGKEENAGVF